MKQISLKEFEGKRIDEALALANVYPSRSIAKQMLNEGKVKLGNKCLKPSYKIEAEKVIDYEEYVPASTSIKGEDIPLDILYEDDDVFVINKPQGMIVHPGNGHVDGTLVNALVARQIALANPNDPIRPGLVHRIDKDTSGCLLIVKNEKAYQAIQAQLATHTMHREYLALVKGIILEDDGKIIAPIGRDRQHPTKNCVDLNNGKEATTYFHVEKRFKKDDCTLVSCRLLTGRTHQIRVHMEYIGHPVIGDPIYGSGNRKIYDKGQLLHAYRLSFIHPTSQKETSVEAPLPAYFKDILAKLS